MIKQDFMVIVLLCCLSRMLWHFINLKTMITRLIFWMKELSVKESKG